MEQNKSETNKNRKRNFYELRNEIDPKVKENWLR